LAVFEETPQAFRVFSRRPSRFQIHG
jgi:hypothetical protein